VTERLPDKSAGGHRRRLRERFARAGLAAFHDHEVVELLLTLGTPRRDCKVVAREALRRFKTLRAVLEASPAELQEIKGIGPVNSLAILLVRAVAERYLKEGVLARPVLDAAQQVFDYLYLSMRGLKKEVFGVIYLDNQHHVLDIADLFTGSVAGSTVAPREVIQAAIAKSASALIFVHNHPSGDPAPSSADRELTRELVYAAGVMKMRALDHIIIGDKRYFSFAAAGLMEEYETSFLDLRLKGVSEARRRIYRAQLFGGPPDKA